MRRLDFAPLLLFGVAALPFSGTAYPQSPELGPAVKGYVKVQAAKIVLMHVRVIDGTGAATVDDRNLTIENGKISSIDKGADVGSSGNTTAIDLRGYSFMPGIVGMHNHLFYIASPNLTAERRSNPPR